MLRMRRAHRFWTIKMGGMMPGGGELRCYQLSDGRRVFSGEDVLRLFGMVSQSNVNHNQGGHTPPRSN